MIAMWNNYTFLETFIGVSGEGSLEAEWGAKAFVVLQSPTKLDGQTSNLAMTDVPHSYRWKMEDHGLLRYSGFRIAK